MHTTSMAGNEVAITTAALRLKQEVAHSDDPQVRHISWFLCNDWQKDILLTYNTDD